MTRFLDRCTQAEAKKLNKRIKELIVGEKLPFFILESPFWRRLWQEARPAFYPEMINIFEMSATGVQEVYDDVNMRMDAKMARANGLKTLAGV